MKRFTTFDPVCNFYNNPRNVGKTLSNGKSDDLIKKWYHNKIGELTKNGYKENKNADVTGGDHDYIIIDHIKKEWCWWENGFWPFCGESFPTDHTLEYWANRRR